MRTSFAIGISALLAAAAAGSLGAVAQDVEKEALAKPQKFYAAIVSSAGAIIDSVDVDAVARTSAGQYTVTFNKKIEQCFPVATIFSGTSGAIRVVEVIGNQKQLFVRTRSEGTATTSPVFADRAFSIVVICP